MRLDHPIFQGPLQPGIELQESDWEQEYDDRGVWVVQTGEPGKDVDYGVVSDGHGFEDSPDCERISGGVNSKGPYAVAIGRQANMLQWGFYAAPDRMTESGRRVFLNALVYMRQFDGHRPLVDKVSRGRGWMNQYAEAVGDLADMDPEVRGRYRDYLAAQFPERFFAEEEVDIAALKAWVAENLEYFRFEGNLFPVDEQLKALGVSNRTPAFLDLLEQRLAADPRDELALELCGRYLGRHAEDGAAALQWIRENRDRLYFTDVGGFRWFAAPEAVVGAAEAPAPPTQASGASEREPLRR